MSLYSDPLIYDIVHADATGEQVAALRRLASGWNLTPADGLWLEPACGSGRLLDALADHGFPVVGFDREPAMVDYARRRLGERGRVELADLVSFVPPVERGSVEVAINLINTIRHLDSDDALLAHLRQIAEALTDSGRYVVGISLSDYTERLADEDIWRGESEGVSVVQVVQALPPGRRREERIISHLIIQRGEQSEPEHRDDRYTLRSYSPREWSEVIDRSPLAIDEVFDIFGEPTELDVGYVLCSLTPRKDSR